MLKTEFIAFWMLEPIYVFEAEDQPYPEMRVERIGGHTQFHQVLCYKDEDLNLMAGDVMATRAQLNRVFAAKYDYDPTK